MPAINVDKVIGAGGDFTTLAAAITYLNGLVTLTVNYTFHLVSNTVETTGVTPTYDANSHTVTFTAYPHYGIVANAINVSLASGTAAIYFYIKNGNLVVENLYISKVTSYAQHAVTLQVQTAGSIVFRNNLLSANGNSASFMLSTYGNVGTTRVTECLLWGNATDNGINIDYLSNAVIENTAIYHCINGVADGWDNSNATLRNVGVYTCATCWNFTGSGAGRAVLVNCSDSGTSINVSTHRTACIVSVNTGLDFKSIDPSSVSFFRPTFGRTMSLSGTAPLYTATDMAGSSIPDVGRNYPIGPFVTPDAVVVAYDSFADLGTVTTTRFMTKPDWATQQPISTSIGRQHMQYGVGPQAFRDLTADLAWSVQYSFTNMARDDEYVITNFFNTCRGRLRKFWLPMWGQRFQLGAAIAAGQTTVSFPQAYGDYFPSVVRGWERLFMLLVDGSFLTRKVVSAVGDGYSVNINTPWDRAIAVADVAVFGQMVLARFDQDDLEIQHETDRVSTCEIQFVELPKEYDLPGGGS